MYVSQVYLAQNFLKYHFWIDYYQGKANRTANTLLQYSQRSGEKEANLWGKNIKILH